MGSGVFLYVRVFITSAVCSTLAEWICYKWLFGKSTSETKDSIYLNYSISTVSAYKNSIKGGIVSRFFRKHYFYQRCTWKILLWEIKGSKVSGRIPQSFGLLSWNMRGHKKKCEQYLWFQVWPCKDRMSAWRLADQRKREGG